MKPWLSRSNGLTRASLCWHNEQMQIFYIHGYLPVLVLAFNFYLLTLLAFLFHQISELTDAAFKACRAKAGSKVSFWEKIRTLINFFIFESWEQLLAFFINKHDDFQVADGFVIPRSHPP